MRVLFDNNVPAPLRFRLAGHQVITARERGWAELRNGELLKTAEAEGFEVFVTGDKNLSYQQNLRERSIAIVVLPTIHWKTLRQNSTNIQAAVNRAQGGSFEALSLP